MAKIANKLAMTFDDVLIQPGFSAIRSRSTISISQDFLGHTYDLPIISANMDYVTESKMAVAMSRAGGFYVLHRFMDLERLLNELEEIELETLRETNRLSFSIGIRDTERELSKVERIESWFPKADLVITVDVAHGHHNRVYNLVKQLKDKGHFVIAGNVATYSGYMSLAESGADAVKVGIGPGSVCTTREVTGVGVPQLSAIMDCYEASLDINEPVPIIADGGIKNSGDIVKALAAGADMVMLGSLLAGTSEAPGEHRVDTNGKTWRPYRGQSIFGVNASHYTPEGIEGWVEDKGPVENVLKALAGGIRSGCSYVGANNLNELREKTTFIQVTQATHIESGTRVLRELVKDA